jgi:hypothetical protein
MSLIAVEKCNNIAIPGGKNLDPTKYFSHRYKPPRPAACRYAGEPNNTGASKSLFPSQTKTIKQVEFVADKQQLPINSLHKVIALWVV